MAFYQLDDQLTVNAKMRRLTEGSLVGDLRGMAAQALWAQAGTLCQASLTDGVVSRVDTIRLLLNPPLADELAGLLVDAGLWHAPGHTCPDCEPVAAEHYRFHQWWQFKYDPAEKVKAARAKRAELKDRDLRDAVWARDAVDPADPNVAACRYCGTHVNRHDHTSQRAPHLDHVDPSLAKGATNLAVACGDCSQRKGQRTPAQAGMPLRPAPRPLAVPPTAASPRTRAAEAPRSPQGASTTPDDARGPQGPAGHVTGAEGATGSQPEPAASQQPPLPAVPGRTRTGGRTGAGKAGTGAGLGRGAGEGSGSPRSRRSRRRGRGARPHDQRSAPPTDQDPPADPGQSWDAGPAPDVVTPGRWGSPWYGGRRGDDDPETHCPTHGEHLPCRRCREETP